MGWRCDGLSREVSLRAAGWQFAGASSHSQPGLPLPVKSAFRLLNAGLLKPIDPGIPGFVLPGDVAATLVQFKGSGIGPAGLLDEGEQVFVTPGRDPVVFRIHHGGSTPL